jgi:Holliday junction resolvase
VTPEKKVKNEVAKLLIQHHAWYFMPVSNGMGRHGIPDFICCVKGKFFAVECKAGAGVTTALQARELARILDAGGTAFVINEKNLDVLEAYLNETS